MTNMPLSEKHTGTKILLVEPIYYSRYPPLGLLKISAYYKSIGAEIKYVRGQAVLQNYCPDIIEITSLFTYTSEPVHNAISYYHKQFPNATINVGGIYASLQPNEIKALFPYVNVQVGLNEYADSFLPDYNILPQVEKWKDWNSSILFTSRGCINNCSFCMVPKLEGKIRSVVSTPSKMICPDHRAVIIWDNNFLALDDWEEKLTDLKLTGKWIDFNQGLDAKLMDDSKAKMLASMKIKEFRMAYDSDKEKNAAHNAVRLLSKYGIDRRCISFYTLYNFYNDRESGSDTPETFYKRVLDILELGCVSYPMRFVPFTAKHKNEYISPLWTAEKLEMVAKARRVVGFGGAFPPYHALVNKFKTAGCFDKAFELRSINGDR